MRNQSPIRLGSNQVRKDAILNQFKEALAGSNFFLQMDQGKDLLLQVHDSRSAPSKLLETNR